MKRKSLVCLYKRADNENNKNETNKRSHSQASEKISWSSNTTPQFKSDKTNNLSRRTECENGKAHEHTPKKLRNKDGSRPSSVLSHGDRKKLMIKSISDKNVKDAGTIPASQVHCFLIKHYLMK